MRVTPRWDDVRQAVTGSADIPESVADAVLNRRRAATRGGALGVYQRASRCPEQVKATEHRGRLLAASIEGREPRAEVVRLVPRMG
jgi:hypothetical protein